MLLKGKGMINTEDRHSRRKKLEDTGKIPIIRNEEAYQERLNDERYRQIVLRQQQEEAARRRNARPVRNVQTDENNYAKKDKQKEKTKHGCGCSSMILCMFLAVVIVFVGVVGYGFHLCSKTNYDPSGMNFTSSDIMSDSEVYNVLLIGADKLNEAGTTRSDTMLLVSIDNRTKTLKFTSFMRDMWVEIPGYDDAKLNAAFSYGGAELLIKTIQQNFKVKIDNYVMVDFNMFQQLIDGLGGVTVDITEKEANFINRTTHAKVEVGENHLNGDYALIYCRIRKLDSDFGRTQRQRKVMAAIFEQIKSQNILTTLKTAGDVMPYVTTDISPVKMMLKALGAVKYLTYGNDELRLPIDGEYADRYINGQAALVVDFDTNIEAVQEFIYG